MAAWTHRNGKGWNAKVYYEYSAFVMSKAESFEKSKDDCADLSLSLMIDFAAENGLCLTFLDNAFNLYISKATARITGSAGRHKLDTDEKWTTKDEYKAIVQRKIGVESLWRRNTSVNRFAPLAGDLMMIYSKGDRHHTALVYRAYAAGASHAKQNDPSVPSFPGADAAMDNYNQTRYFRGTVDSKSGVTSSRAPDHDAHFDYLNSRGDDKRNAELIYYANFRQLREDGFEFRMYKPLVIDDWFDWNGQGLPPFGTHRWPPSDWS